MRSSAVPGSSPIACVRHVALGLTALMLTSACGGSDGPVGPLEIPEHTVIEEKFAALAAVTDQPALSIFDFSLLTGVSAERSVGVTLDRVLLRSLPDKGAPLLWQIGGEHGPRASRVTAGVLTAAAEPAIRAGLYGRTYTDYPNWRLDTLANGQPVPGAPTNGVRFKLPAVDASGQVTDPHVANMDIVNASPGGRTGYTVTVRTLTGAIALGATVLPPPQEHITGYLAHEGRRYSFEESTTYSPTGNVQTTRGAAPFAGLQYESKYIIEVGGFDSWSTAIDFRLTLDADAFHLVLQMGRDFGDGALSMNGRAMGKFIDGKLTLPGGQADAGLSAFFDAFKVPMVRLPMAGRLIFGVPDYALARAH